MARMSSGSWLITAAMITLALAGCTESSNPAAGPSDVPDAGPASFSDTTGALSGRVVDEEQLPIVGAQVGLVLEPFEATRTSDSRGKFVFSNLEPGTYKLFVNQLGYKAAAKNVVIKAGEETVDSVTLEANPLPVAYPLSLHHRGQYGTGVAVVRTTLCLSGCGSNASNYFLFGGFKDDTKGVIVESQWDTADFLGFDLNTRTTPSNMYYRVRQQSPVHYLVKMCESYAGPPNYGRTPMPCTADEIKATQGTTTAAAHLETWYVGLLQDQTHAADAVCREPVSTVLPGYEAGCYGVGVAPDLKWETWVTMFILELPADAATFSVFGDR
jgi:hypothetical protein